MSCFKELHQSVVGNFHCYRSHYTLLRFLADLFKLFILLNYIYFMYMIFAYLFVMVSSFFERKPDQERCATEDRTLGRDFYRKKSRCTCKRPSDSRLAAHEQSRSQPGPALCNLLFSRKSKMSPDNDVCSENSKPAPNPVRGVCSRKSKPASSPQRDVCSMKSKQNTSPARDSCSKSKAATSPVKCEPSTCSASVERIQVEFNCKKKSKKSGKMTKKRSCTKCGKHLPEPSKQTCASRLPITCRRRRNDSECDSEYTLRR